MTTTHQDLAAQAEALRLADKLEAIDDPRNWPTLDGAARMLRRLHAALEAASQPPGAVEFENMRRALVIARDHIEMGKLRSSHWKDAKAIDDALSAPSPAQAPVVQRGHNGEIRKELIEMARREGPLTWADRVLIGRAMGALATTQAAVLREPTQAMLEAARDWSYRVYGKPIGNDAAIGCWQTMFDAGIGVKGADHG